MKEKILELLRKTDGFLSGEEISREFGVSRTSIWKAIRQLESMGYEIEAVRNKGYRLCQEADLLTRELVEKALQTSWAGGSVQVFDSIDSTNNEAKRQAEAGAPQGLLVLAEEQTAGRGRRGRVWESNKGDGIFMSLLLKPEFAPDRASMLTLLMGMAVRDALEMAGVKGAQIKWPNDIVCSGKKLCGILTEMSAEMDYINHVVIGVGINVHHRTFAPEISHLATSVYMETKQRICRAKLVADCMRCFETYYTEFLKTEDLSGVRPIYEKHLVNLGEKVCVLDPKQEYVGVAQGITPEGSLLVQTETALHSVSSGEVSVRGVYGYV